MLAVFVLELRNPIYDEPMPEEHRHPIVRIAGIIDDIPILYLKIF
jgi:hypothetical protein